MLVNVGTNELLNSLEYWLLKPYHRINDRDLPYVKEVLAHLQNLQTVTLYSEEFDKTLSDIEAAYHVNKMRYQYVERRQIEKAIKAMSGSVLSRMISKNVVPVTTKVAQTVGPVVNKALNETVYPAANKALCFMHKTFAKKKIEVVEVNQDSTENP